MKYAFLASRFRLKLGRKKRVRDKPHHESYIPTANNIVMMESHDMMTSRHVIFNGLLVLNYTITVFFLIMQSYTMSLMHLYKQIKMCITQHIQEFSP